MNRNLVAAMLLVALSLASAHAQKMKTDIPASITTPDSIETSRLGKLEFLDGVPTDATTQKLYDHLDFMRGVGATVVIRGIRAVSDYEYELQMALMNRRLQPRIETVFMMSAEAYSYVSSRLVKEIYLLGGAIEGLVPASVESRMRKKFGPD